MTDDDRQESDLPLSDRLAEAFSLALELHRTQSRKRAKGEPAGSGIPYIAHLMNVAALVLEQGGSEDEAIAALLHDGPEDQGGERTLEEIRRRFGDNVAEIVDGCSDTLETPKPEWRARKEKYLAHLRATTSESILLVSIADKVHNLSSILSDYRRLGDALWERFSGRRDGTLWYYRELLRIYEEKAPARGAGLVAEMERVYRELIGLVGESSS